MLHLYIEQTPQALNVCGVFILCSHTVDYASYPGWLNGLTPSIYPLIPHANSKK